VCVCVCVSVCVYVWNRNSSYISQRIWMKLGTKQDNDA
jgi:hypothetical protein